MTKQETIKIMALLGAFYAGGKNDPKIQAEAWYMVLYKYDFEVAKVAVLRFAENDKREYATFPTVGCIVNAIKEEEYVRNRPIKEIMRGVSYGTSYSNLSEGAHKLISEEQYKEWLNINAETFQHDAEHYENLLKGKRNYLLEQNYD